VHDRVPRTLARSVIENLDVVDREAKFDDRQQQHEKERCDQRELDQCLTTGSVGTSGM
jgi:hypothetical protein